MLKDYWFSGIGPGNAAFNLVYPAYSFNTIKAPHAHNLYLQLMCDAGILGLALFLLVIVSFYRTVFSAFSRERDRKSRYYLAAAAAAVGGFLAQGVTDYSFYNNRVLLFFWVVVALGIVMSRRSGMEKGHALWSES
jgi:putative inorganic carbon (HCO3(-)) transporter